MSDTPDDLAAGCAASLAAIAESAPRVHCLTSPVAMTLTANLLLAVGARPSMTASADQIGGFIAASGALCVNLGMLDEPRRLAIDAALAASAEHAVPWVLDPVKVNLSPERRDYALTLLDRRPTAVRGNAREIAALAGGDDPALPAREFGCVVAVTGAEDRISDGERRLTLAGGTPLLARTVASGCALSALVAAFLAVGPDPAGTDPFAATAQALLAMKVAGARAARAARGPGSLPAALLDELAALDADHLSREGRWS